MKCPACGGKTRTQQTIPAENRNDGRVYRTRKCLEEGCGTLSSTLEIYHSERNLVLMEGAAQPAAPTAPVPVVAIPMAAPGTCLFDLEGGLEKGLKQAVACIVDAVDTTKPAPDKVRVDAAKWLIEDRRKWRIATAQQLNQAGTTPADPAMAELTGILRLLPLEASA